MKQENYTNRLCEKFTEKKYEVARRITPKDYVKSLQKRNMKWENYTKRLWEKFTEKKYEVGELHQKIMGKHYNNIK